MRRPIENNSSAGQAVYEPFCGSGTTIIAAEMTGRACHAIELSPAYIDVAVKRWEAFIGSQATLEGDGRSFSVIADERAPFDRDAELASRTDSRSARARNPASRRRRAAAPRAGLVQNHRRGCRARPRSVAAALAGAN
jgi:hypothetical protein